MVSRLYTVFSLSVLLIGLTAALNNRPVIGILTIPSKTTGHPSANYSYFPSSYPKYVESAGARVIPIPYDAPFENLTFLLSQVNGVVLTGGGAAKTIKDLNTGKLVPSNLTKAVIHIVDHVLEANRRGEYFPLMATCLGYEMMLMALAKDLKILYTKYHDLSVRAGVEFFRGGENSRFWGHLPDSLKDFSEDEPAFAYHHYQAILPDKFMKSKGISNVLKITSISYPVNGGGPPFVASVEGIKYPIYGIQFHPEKAAYEWLKETNAPHFRESLEISQRMINFFVNEARKNDRKFISEEVLQKSLLSNWVLSQRSSTYHQVYLFRTVLQEPASWPALFNLPKRLEEPVLQLAPRIKLKSKEMYELELFEGADDADDEYVDNDIYL